MSNELVIPKGLNIPARFQGRAVENNLAKGVHTGFGVIGYKGRNWSVRFRGEETHLKNQDGDPVASINVVILESAPNISKVYYEGSWVEGSTEAPDCYSVNGLVPENDSKKKQSNTCAACPHNVWGSRINEKTGKKGKACMDSKRAAVVPFDDIKNEVYGGPMLLRIPAASMANAANYAGQLGGLGYPVYAVGTKVSFKVGESYPLMEFSVVPRPMTDEQADLIDEMRKHPSIAQILGTGGEYEQAAAHEAVAKAATLPDPKPSPVGTVEQPKVTPEATPAPKSNGAHAGGFGGGEVTTKPKPGRAKKEATPAPTAMQEALAGVEEDEDFDTLLAKDMAEAGIE